MRHTWKLTSLSALADSLITWHTITESSVSPWILVIRLVLFAIAGLLVLVERPLSKATNPTIFTLLMPRANIDHHLTRLARCVAT